MLSLRNDGAYGFSIGGPKYSTDELTAEIFAAVEEKDETKAKQMFADLENKFKEDVTYLNLFENLKGSVIAKDLKGFRHIERGYIDITGFYK